MVKRNQRGITLIALVITIIVLLILAGVSIQILVGENGLIIRTINTKEIVESSEVLDNLKMEVAASYDNGSNINTQTLAKNLSEIEGIKYINDQSEEVAITDNTEIKLTAKVKLNGYSIK